MNRSSLPQVSQLYHKDYRDRFLARQLAVIRPRQETRQDCEPQSRHWLLLDCGSGQSRAARDTLGRRVGAGAWCPVSIGLSCGNQTEATDPVARVVITIPLFNKRAAIRRAVQSILAQSFADYELYIVDDGSTDDSVDQISDFIDPRIRIIRQENMGPGAARNRGAAEGHSPYLAFLDADDEWEPDYLARSVARLDAHEQVAASVMAYFIGTEKRSTEAGHLSFGMKEGVWRIPAHLDPASIKRYVDFCHSSCVVVRREVFVRHGGFYAKNRCLYGEDSYLWLMVVLNHHLYLDPRPCVWFHTEDSALGKRLLGRHPLRPALADPQPLRERCDASGRTLLEDLLAYYRLIETEKLARHRQSALIADLRSAFPWRRSPGFAMRKREAKVDIRRVLNAFVG